MTRSFACEELQKAWVLIESCGYRRLYEHLCETTKDQPDATLEDLQPLYQAVAHGCQAGLQQEAMRQTFLARIERGDVRYAMKKLGAFGSNLGAFASFFDSPWGTVLQTLAKEERAFLFGAVAFHLRALGRLTEALEPMRAGLKSRVEEEEYWVGAAIDASNLSELELALGEVAGAVGDAEQSMTYADRSGDAFMKMALRTTHADALHQAGRRAEAQTPFREAEQMQAERQPDYPLLYSVQGFQYCDLLLAAPERAAWHTILGRAELSLRLSASSSSPATPAAQQRSPTDDGFDTARRELDAAVDGLRRAGTTHHIPRGLLTRAWLRFLTGACTGPESAQSDLDEAWEIAERNPMRLFLADIHLHRARLFARSGGVISNQLSVISGEKYPWESPAADLAAARKLIEQCKYWRRKEELEDAEDAAQSWKE